MAESKRSAKRKPKAKAKPRAKAKPKARAAARAGAAAKKAAPLKAASRPRGSELDPRLIWAVLGAAVVAFLVVWLLIPSDEKTETDAGPAIVSAGELRHAAGRAGFPVYWAGEQPDSDIELSFPDGGGSKVRYVSKEGGSAAAPNNSLTVSTYPLQGAYKAVLDIKKQPGGMIWPLPNGGVAAYSSSQPNSVYIAYRASAEQVEIYAPDASRARQLARSGRVVPAG